MNIKICGIKHEIIECEDSFDMDCHLGQIDYKNCVIKINKDMDDQMKEQTIFHEVLHGMFVLLGYQEQSNDEQFVQALSNAIYQTFKLREQIKEQKDE